MWAIVGYHRNRGSELRNINVKHWSAVLQYGTLPLESVMHKVQLSLCQSPALFLACARSLLPLSLSLPPTLSLACAWSLFPISLDLDLDLGLDLSRLR